ncbi:type III polyketide synthase [Paenibacillus chartarius]|uniref:Type III polyketide synthase n=1 Tax=Paenibacillus chartarius TaxID=747481 RepID=A0ABV6DT93_9BACL
MEQEQGAAAIVGMGTALPAYKVDQEEAAERLARAAAGQAEADRWVRRLFRQSAVRTRYTCEPSFLRDSERCDFLPGTPQHRVPTTAMRGQLYREHALPLAAAAAKRAMDDAGVRSEDITHLLAVSCTGLHIPGIDAELVRALELRPDVERLPLYFLGCAAGLKAIGIAGELVRHDPAAKALVVCVELCTLHVQPAGERHELVAAAMFGDGAAACVVGAADDALPAGGTFRLGAKRSVLLPDGADAMTWTVGNTGFELFLSPRIPELLGLYAGAELERLGVYAPGVDLWAVHPGGRAILDTVQSLWGLSGEQLAASRTVLRNYGNLSSATILFVLDQLRRDLSENGGLRHGEAGVAMAFGPGLTVELLQIRFEAPKGAVR